MERIDVRCYNEERWIGTSWRNKVGITKQDRLQNQSPFICETVLRAPMKKFAFIFGIVLIAAILIAAGYSLGFGQRFMVDAYSSTALDKALADAAIRARLLHELDSGHIDDARGLLRSQLDGDVVTIWAFGDYSDTRSRKMATNVLAGIAAFRAEYPSNYTSRISGDEAQVDAKIASILEQARKAQSQ